MKTKPYQYQQEAVNKIVEYAKEHDGKYIGALLYKPGRGKTLTSMTAVESLAMNGFYDSMIVVAPKSVLATWEAQIERHGDFPTKPFRWESTKATTDKYKLAFHVFFEKQFPIFLVNVEAFQSQNKQLESIMKSFVKQKKPFVIVDESTRIKSHKSARTKNLTALCKPVKGKMLLSGTPTPNSIVDIWSQFEFLHEGFWREKSFYVFEHTYTVKIKQRIADGKEIERTASMADVKDMRNRVEKAKGFPMTPKNEAFIQRLEMEADALERKLLFAQKLEQQVFDQIKPYVFYAENPEGLPENIDTELVIEMTHEEKKVYKEFKNTLMTMTASGEILSVKNRAGLFHKARQITGGSIDREHGVEQETPSKIRALIDDIEDHEEPAIILSGYIRNITEIAKALEPYGGVVMHYGEIPSQERDENLKKAIAGEVRFIVANPSTIGTGVDGLQHRFSMMYFYDTPMFPDQWEQTRKRIDRDGQKNVCVYKHLISQGTVDERCLMLIKQKQDLQARFEKMSEEEFGEMF